MFISFYNIRVKSLQYWNIYKCFIVHNFLVYFNEYTYVCVVYVYLCIRLHVCSCLVSQLSHCSIFSQPSCLAFFKKIFRISKKVYLVSYHRVIFLARGHKWNHSQEVSTFYVSSCYNHSKISSAIYLLLHTVILSPFLRTSCKRKLANSTRNKLESCLNRFVSFLS